MSRENPTQYLLKNKRACANCTLLVCTMAASTEKSCTVCCKAVSESNQRRRLYSQPNVVSALKSILSSLSFSSVFLPSQNTESFLCIKCSGTLTSLHNTREKEARLHEELKKHLVETARHRNIAISVPGKKLATKLFSCTAAHC